MTAERDVLRRLVSVLRREKQAWHSAAICSDNGGGPEVMTKVWREWVREKDSALVAAEEVLKPPDEAREEVRANDHKIGWRDCEMEYLLDRLEEEVSELRSCKQEAVVSEAADVANFAMMVADKAYQLKKLEGRK